MAIRTNKKLKVFLNGTLTQYNALSVADKVGTVFFDRTNHALYAEGVCVMKSEVENVTYNQTTTELVITALGGTQTTINLGIQTELDNLKATLETWAGSHFVRYDVNTQNLTDTQKTNARTNIGTEAADATILKQKHVVNNLTTDSATLPLSAAQGKALSEGKVDKDGDKGLSTNDYTDEDKDKLDTIARGAQVNKISAFKANNTEVGGTANGVTVSLSGNLVDSSSAASGNVGFNLSHKYIPTENKIYFFNSATAPTTGTEGYIFAIDTSDFVQAGMINKVEYNSVTGELNITFPTIQTDGTLKDTTVKVDLSKLVDVYKAGNGLTATVGTDGTTFTVVLGDGLAFDANKAITLSLGSGLSIDNSGKLVVDFASDGVTSINGMGSGAYTINTEGVTVGTTGNALRPIEVVNDSAAKKLKIKARPADMLAQFFRENNENATSGIRAKGVLINEAADGNPYSMVMDFTPKVWSF